MKRPAERCEPRFPYGILRETALSFLKSQTPIHDDGTKSGSILTQLTIDNEREHASLVCATSVSPQGGYTAAALGKELGEMFLPNLPCRTCRHKRKEQAVLAAGHTRPAVRAVRPRQRTHPRRDFAGQPLRLARLHKDGRVLVRHRIRRDGRTARRQRPRLSGNTVRRGRICGHPPRDASLRHPRPAQRAQRKVGKTQAGSYVALIAASIGVMVQVSKWRCHPSKTGTCIPHQQEKKTGDFSCREKHPRTQPDASR